MNDTLDNPLGLTQHETEVILRAILENAGDAGVLEDHVLACVDWCQQARVNAAILDTVLAGMVYLSWDEDKGVLLKARP